MSARRLRRHRAATTPALLAAIALLAAVSPVAATAATQRGAASWAVAPPARAGVQRGAASWGAASQATRASAATTRSAPPAAPEAAARPNGFLHDVDRVNGHLRVAIEFAPEELGEALGTADVVCSLGQRAAAQGAAEDAAADWSTLRQLVDGPATDAVRRVDVAFANADGVLSDLRERYERRWAGDPRLGKLRRGVHATRLGIRIMRRAIGDLRIPFAAWRAEECLTATEGVTTAFRRIPTGLRLIDLGMLELWRLAGLLPSPEEGS